MVKYNYIIHGLRRGHVVSLPTDTIYGLSCIIHPNSIEQLLALKKRDAKKGFIILTSDLEYVSPYLDDEVIDLLRFEYTTINTPTTFVVPCSHSITADNTLAIRLTTHPSIHFICKALGQAIISTSANLSDKNVIRNMWSFKKYFGSIKHYIRPTYNDNTPSQIINLLTKECYR